LLLQGQAFVSVPGVLVLVIDWHRITDTPGAGSETEPVARWFVARRGMAGTYATAPLSTGKQRHRHLSLALAVGREARASPQTFEPETERSGPTRNLSWGQGAVVRHHGWAGEAPARTGGYSPPPSSTLHPA
jgi:hypothetical protein